MKPRGVSVVAVCPGWCQVHRPRRLAARPSSSQMSNEASAADEKACGHVPEAVHSMRGSG